MRLIWSQDPLDNDNIDTLRKFCLILQAKEINYLQEEIVDSNWASDTYGNRIFRLWIVDEDQVVGAQKLLEAFLQNPELHKVDRIAAKLQDSKLAQPESEMPANETMSDTKRFLEKKLKTKIKPPSERSFKTHFRLTNFLILICCSLLLLTLWTETSTEKIPPAVSSEIITTSPLEKALLFDYPESFELIDKIVSLYGYDALLKPKELPPAGKLLYEEHLKSAPWQGAYPYFVQTCKRFIAYKAFEPPMWQDIEFFGKIKKGEVWRLVTPILLHADILHLFFNMIWLLILGTQIEAHIGIGRYLIFITLCAVVANVAQYLISGPFFIGFSGVVCSMAFFIRARQKTAPWEGYHMATSTFHFILFFIGALACLSLLTFGLEIFGFGSIQIIIANTAHITGALIGYFLGRQNIFHS